MVIGTWCVIHGGFFLWFTGYFVNVSSCPNLKEYIVTCYFYITMAFGTSMRGALIQFSFSDKLHFIMIHSVAGLYCGLWYMSNSAQRLDDISNT